MPSTTGRPFQAHTKLGRIMSDRGLRPVDVSMGSGVHTRTMSDLLSGRKRPTPSHLARISEFLAVPPTAILEDSYPFLASDANRPPRVEGSVPSPSESDDRIITRAVR